jgi:hypothetical protein
MFSLLYMPYFIDVAHYFMACLDRKLSQRSQNGRIPMPAEDMAMVLPGIQMIMKTWVNTQQRKIVEIQP